MGEPRLHDIQFLYHERPRPEATDTDLLELVEDEEIIANTARDLGAHVIQVLRASGPETELQTDIPTYRLNVDPDNYRGKTIELHKVHGQRFPLLLARTLPELSSTESIDSFFNNGQSFVLTYARKHGKYLIEHEGQLEKVLRLQADHPEMAACFHDCEIRPYLKTPSQYETRFQLDVTPVGDVISAGLWHSEQVEGELDASAHGQQSVLPEENEGIHFLKQHFEDPESPYFLDAQHAKPNIAFSKSKIANVIPLIGLGRNLNLPRHQATILDAYGIDPDSRNVPEAINSLAKKIGIAFGPELDLVIGIEIIVDATTRKIYVSDINPDPATPTFAKCHLNAEGNPRVRMRRLALSKIALEKNG